MNPLYPADLVKICCVLDTAIVDDLMYWSALCLSYRCLLRVGHIVSGPHMLCTEDVVFWPGGMDVTLHSSKTVQYREHAMVIPVVQAPGSILCLVQFLRRVFELAPGQPGGPLFHKGGLPYTYNYYTKRLKLLCARVGLIGDYGTQCQTWVGHVLVNVYAITRCKTVRGMEVLGSLALFV